MTQRQTRCRSERGFSLMELGIVLGVMAILFSTVMVMRGYAQGARVTAGIQMVDTLEKASRSWAKRFSNRTGFVTTTGTPISLNGLSTAGLVDSNLQTPWGTAVTVAPSNNSTEWVVIQFNTSDPEAAIDVANALSKKPNVVRNGRQITVTTR